MRPKKRFYAPLKVSTEDTRLHPCMNSYEFARLYRDGVKKAKAQLE